MGYDAYHRRQLAHFVNQTSAAVAYDTRILVVDSYATLRRSMRRTAAVVTRVRRDLIKREVDYHMFIIRLLLLDIKLIYIGFFAYFCYTFTYKPFFLSTCIFSIFIILLFTLTLFTFGFC